MRWTILRTLLHKEILRHLANRGGIVLAVLLLGIALLLTLGRAGSEGPLLGGEVQRCYLIYSEEDTTVLPWIAHLKERVPAEWTEDQFRIRTVAKMRKDGQENILYPDSAGGIHLFTETPAAGTAPPRFRVWFWHPGENKLALASYQAWFWRETLLHFHGQAPLIGEENYRLRGSADVTSFVAVVLVFFALFFACVYLLPSMTCEERERGLLLAQALSPATPLEILTAKFLFYPVAAIVLSGALAGIYRPVTLASPFFWLAVLVSALGSMGIGLTIATLARTQRLASIGAMCYLLILALVLVTLQQNQIPYLSQLVLEYHTTKILHAALDGNILPDHWLHLLVAALLALGWAGLAGVLFRKQGWQ